MIMNPTIPPSVPSFFQHLPTVEGSISPLRIPSDIDSRTESKPMVRIFYESGRYWVEHPERSRDPSKTLWVVIRQNKYPCVLNSGDMLKMGRYKIRVREAVAEYGDTPAETQSRLTDKRFSVASTDSYDADTFDGSDDGTALAEDGSPIISAPNHPLVDIQSVEVCRICYDSGDDENPLIAPCKCSGSMQYVHLSCLRKWMDGRLSVNNPGAGKDGAITTVSYFWRNLDCELCKVAYPTSVERPRRNSLLGVETVDLYELPKPQSPFIVLESNIRMPQQQPGGAAGLNSSTMSVNGSPVTFQKGLHIMSLTKNRSNVLVGRGHDADVRINDISVSRLHASIRLVQGTVNGVRRQQIVMEDKGSKFGSLVAVRGPIPLEPGVPLSIQCGRTVTTISIKKPNLLSSIMCLGGKVGSTLGSGSSGGSPVLISESSPVVDLKHVLESSSFGVAVSGAQPVVGPHRARASVASTALRRASEALSMIQLEREIEEQQQVSPQNGDGLEEEIHPNITE